MSVVLTAAEIERRNKLAGMLGSEHSGEVLNAVSFLRKMADERKITLVELLTSSPSSSSSNGTSYGYSDYRARQQEQARREAEERARREREEWGRPYNLPRDWRDRLSQAYERHSRKTLLSEWEKEFVSDVLARGELRPTERQAAVVKRILGKLDLAEKRERARANAQHEPWEDE